MTREEAVSLLMAQVWIEEVYTFRLIQVRRSSHAYLHLKEAFEVLRMGYDCDFRDIKDRDREALTNVNVWRNQFKRASIDVNQLKTIKLSN